MSRELQSKDEFELQQLLNEVWNGGNEQTADPETILQNKLSDMLDEIGTVEGLGEAVGLASFAEAGVMTNNKGLIVKFSTGRRFHLTIVEG